MAFLSMPEIKTLTSSQHLKTTRLGNAMSKFFIYETILILLAGLLSFNTFGDEISSILSHHEAHSSLPLHEMGEQNGPQHI